MFARIIHTDGKRQDILLDEVSQITITVPHYYKVEFIKHGGGVGYIHMSDLATVVVQDLPDR